MNGSTSSQESTPRMGKWKEVKKEKIDVSQRKVKKEEIKVETSSVHDYISNPKADEVDLMDNLKSKVHNWVLSSSLHNLFQTNDQGPKRSWGPKFF